MLKEISHEQKPSSVQRSVTRSRFVLMEHPPKGEADPETKWWQDTWRPLSEKDELEAGYRYMAVQTYSDKDPNNYRPVTGEMRLLFTDQCEYYVVCPDCYYAYSDMQWPGSTRSHRRDWREEAERDRKDHHRLKGWCEFCDPIFGNGGWCR